MKNYIYIYRIGIFKLVTVITYIHSDLIHGKTDSHIYIEHDEIKTEAGYEQHEVIRVRIAYIWNIMES